ELVNESHIPPSPFASEPRSLTMEMRIPAAILEARQTPVTEVIPTGIEFSFSPQLSAHFDKDTRALWSRWTADPRPCFNPSLLADIRAYYDFIAQSRGVLQLNG